MLMTHWYLHNDLSEKRNTGCLKMILLPLNQAPIKKFNWVSGIRLGHLLMHTVSNTTLPYVQIRDQRKVPIEPMIREFAK